MTARTIDQFVRFAEAEASTVERLPSVTAAPGAVASYLATRNLPPLIVPAPGGIAAGIDWVASSTLRVASRPDPDGSTVVTGCYCGLAEAGAIVMLSSQAHPTEYSFLAETHIVLLPTADVLTGFEALWSRLRDEFGSRLPRTLNLIVGPSRTADLGLPTKLGAHGPARVHILLLDNAENADSQAGR